MVLNFLEIPLFVSYIDSFFVKHNYFKITLDVLFKKTDKVTLKAPRNIREFARFLFSSTTVFET